MIQINHARCRWTSQKGVEILPVDYEKYPANQGYTDIRYFEVDLNKYDMDLLVDPKKTISQFADRAEVVMNGTFSSSGQPIGYIVKEGSLLNGTSAPQWIDFMIHNGKAEIGQLDPKQLTDISLSFSSTPQLVKNGQLFINVHGEQTPKDVYASRRPRTGLGIKKDGILIAVVVDGDSGYDAGLRVDELGAVMIHLGAWDANNLDGGGSSCLAQNGKMISGDKGTRQQGAAITFHPKAVADQKQGYRIAHIKDRKNTRYAAGETMRKQYLTIHTTNNYAETANAEMHRRYLETTEAFVSFHLCVDEKETIELMPLGEASYSAGDGANGEHNKHDIAMEICCHLLDKEGKLDRRVYLNAVATAAKIITEQKVTMIQHRDVPERSWKNCPHAWILDYAQFKKDVEARIGKVKEETKAVSSLYRVQVGAFGVKGNAERLLQELQSKGYAGIIKEE